MALIDEGLGRQKTMGLDCNVGSRRSSLRLRVQSDVVFIMSYNVHRPWNIIEGHGKMMTKGYKVSEECFLGRRAFDHKRKQCEARKKSHHMIY